MTRHAIRVAAIAIALAASAIVPASAAAPPIRRVSGFADATTVLPLDISRDGSRILVADTRSDGSDDDLYRVLDRPTGTLFELSMAEVADLSGNGRFAFGVDPDAVSPPMRERIGSGRSAVLTGALPATGRWDAVGTDSSDDGRRLATVAIDASDHMAVFFHDTVTGRLVRLGAPRAGEAWTDLNAASVSADGGVVAFTRWMTACSCWQAFVWNAETGRTRLLTRSVDAGMANGDTVWAMVAGGGRHAVLTSFATDLVDGTTPIGVPRYYRVDLRTRQVVLIAAAVDWPYRRGVPTISTGGERITFVGWGVQEPAAPRLQTMVWTRGTTSQVSLDLDGGPPNGRSMMALMSDDGRVCAFASTATDLVPSGRSGYFVATLAAP